VQIGIGQGSPTDEGRASKSQTLTQDLGVAAMVDAGQGHDWVCGWESGNFNARRYSSTPLRLASLDLTGGRVGQRAVSEACPPQLHLGQPPASGDKVLCTLLSFMFRAPGRSMFRFKTSGGRGLHLRDAGPPFVCRVSQPWLVLC